MIYNAYKNKEGQWRIVGFINNYQQEICGAVSELVALQQCHIFSQLQRQK